jgi:hypothetical protein
LGPGLEPDIAWTGQELLVLSLQHKASTLTRLDATGRALGSTGMAAVKLAVGGLAWSMEHDAGLVVLDTGVFAIDAAGDVVASSAFTGFVGGVDLMVTPRGFLAVLAVGLETEPGAEEYDALVYASLAPGRAAATWTYFEAGGTFRLAHAVDAHGLATSFAVQPQSAPQALHYDIVDGELAHRHPFDVPPSFGGGAVFALDGATDRALALYASRPSSDIVNELWLMDPASLASARQIDPGSHDVDGSFVRVGPDLVLLSGQIGADGQLSGAPVDPRLPEDPLGPRLAFGGGNRITDSARAVPIPRGVAVTWSERTIDGASFHDDVLLQILDCCASGR